MSFVFLSYSREDLGRAKQVAQLLARERVEVFWDQSIHFGKDHASVIAERLEAAACVLVLWSINSVKSDWVRYEANEARERQTLVEAILDEVRPPPPFPVANAARILQLKGRSRSEDLIKLINSVAMKAQPSGLAEAEMSLAAPRAGQAVTDAHLALIHTSWRDKKYDKQFGGVEMYRWDVILFGSKEALDRVEEVTYLLHPAYELPEYKSHSVNHLPYSKHRKTCFLLSQLANGHSQVRARVKIKGQIEVIALSRYINLFNSKDRVSDYFV